MNKVSFGVEKHFCAECSLALRRFVGKMDGVDSIEVENGMITISFDDAKIPEEKLVRITKDNIGKLGYKLTA